MPDPRRTPHASEEGPTLLFQRGPLALAERCAVCPMRHVLENMPDRPHTSLPHAILPLPPLRGPGAAPPPGPTLARPAPPGRDGRASDPTLTRPDTPPPGRLDARPTPPGRPGPARTGPAPVRPDRALPSPSLTRAPSPGASLPRPALLPPPGAGDTLVLPDALKPAGPDAVTVARPGPTHPTTPTPPIFDELASPDITMLQPLHLRSPPPRRRQPVRSALDARAFFLLNLCLGATIVLALLALATREAAPTLAPAAEHHAPR